MARASSAARNCACSARMKFRQALNGTQSPGSLRAKIGVSPIALTAVSVSRSSNPKLSYDPNAI